MTTSKSSRQHDGGCDEGMHVVEVQLSTRVSAEDSRGISPPVAQGDGSRTAAQQPGEGLQNISIEAQMKAPPVSTKIGFIPACHEMESDNAQLRFRAELSYDTPNGEKDQPPPVDAVEPPPPPPPQDPDSLIDHIENALSASRHETKRSNTNLLLSLDHEQAEERIQLETETTDQEEEGGSKLGLSWSMSQDSTLTASSASTADALSLQDITHASITTASFDEGTGEMEVDIIPEEGIELDNAHPLHMMGGTENSTKSLASETCLSLPNLGTNTTIDSAEAMAVEIDFEEVESNAELCQHQYQVDDNFVQKPKQVAAPFLEEMENSTDTLLLPSSDTSTSTASSDTIVTEALSVADSEADTAMTSATIDSGTQQQQHYADGLLLLNDSYDDHYFPILESESDFALGRHIIMPQQPELRVAALSCTSGNEEEEKTEVDEYIVQGYREEVKVQGPLELPPDVEEGITIDEASHHVPPVIDNKRAEYVSVTVLKSTQAPHDDHGLTFLRVNGKLRVSTISSTGLFADSPLAPFDKMVRINKIDCETLDPLNAAHLLTHLTGSITVIAQNPGGVSDLVESQVTKPLAESPMGVVFQNRCMDDVVMKKELEIASIDSTSPFASALFHVGDRVMAVNQCREDLDRNMANVLLQSAPEQCVMLVQTTLKTQMAIARRPTEQLPPDYNFGRGIDAEEAQHQRDEETGRKQGCYYNSCERPGACVNIFQWLGNVYVITVVSVGIGISWHSIQEQTIDGSDAVGTVFKYIGLLVGVILLGFLVNAPWYFRKVGARFSIAQLVCSIIVIASLIVLLSFDGANFVGTEHGFAILFGLFLPLLIIVNLPSVFVKHEDGSDGNTISDQSNNNGDDEMSFATNSTALDMA